MLIGCYEGVMGCCEGVPRVLLGCSEDIIRVLVGCYRVSVGC